MTAEPASVMFDKAKEIDWRGLINGLEFEKTGTHIITITCGGKRLSIKDDGDTMVIQADHVSPDLEMFAQVLADVIMNTKARIEAADAETKRLKTALAKALERK